VDVGVRVGVADAVRVAVDVRVGLGVLVAVDVRVGLGVLVAVGVRVGLGVLVAVGVRVGFGVLVAVGVRVGVTLGVGVLVRVALAVGLGVTVAITLAPPGDGARSSRQSPYPSGIRPIDRSHAAGGGYVYRSTSSGSLGVLSNSTTVAPLSGKPKSGGAPQTTTKSPASMVLVTGRVYCCGTNPRTRTDHPPMSTVPPVGLYSSTNSEAPSHGLGNISFRQTALGTSKIRGDGALDVGTSHSRASPAPAATRQARTLSHPRTMPPTAVRVLRSTQRVE